MPEQDAVVSGYLLEPFNDQFHHVGEVTMIMKGNKKRDFVSEVTSTNVLRTYLLPYGRFHGLTSSDLKAAKSNSMAAAS